MVRLRSSRNRPFVSIKNLCFSHGEQAIYRGISLNVPYGKITAFMGPSGTGKTTLLRLIGGQLTPSSGSITVNGVDVHSLSQKDLYKLRRCMSILFQSGALFTSLSVYDNVAFPLRSHTNLSESMIRDLVLIKLEMVGLRGAEKLMPSQLSGGMARRAAMARSLSLDPQLMMYDEPFTGQDPINKGILVKLIKELNDALGIASIVVSHDVNEVASIADYIYLVSEGKILAHGTAGELMANDDPAVQQFLHGEADGTIPFRYTACEYREDLLGDC